MRPRAFWLPLFLRLNAVCLLAAFVAAVMPLSWMQAVHVWLGLGDWPSGRLIVYLSRSESLLYGCLGVVTVFVSCDVERYRPLLRFSGLLAAFVGCVLLGLDLYLHMPILWTILEGPPVFVLGLTLALLACPQKPSEKSL
jgi:hypothetical protein